VALAAGCDSSRKAGRAAAAPDGARSRARGATNAPPVTSIPVHFRNVTGETGIRFRLDNGARGEHRFIETTTGGCAFLDYDNDGYLDVFLIQAGPAPAVAVRHPNRPPCALYRNNGNGTFTDVTRETGLDFDQGYAQGVAVADYDNDGWEDLYITAYGGNHLLHNEKVFRRSGVTPPQSPSASGEASDGSPPSQRGDREDGLSTRTPEHRVFQDVTRRAGVADNARGPRWATCAAWGDYDNDGWLDLFVSHYAQWTPEKDTPCNNPRGMRSYCSPDLYLPESPSLYRNNGDGTFADVTAKAGLSRLKGRNFGVVWFDYNDDGYADIFVANDLMPNFLLRNNRNGTFTDVAHRVGVGVMDTGVPLAGMGVGIGDYDNNGREDLLITNFSNQPKVVYRNLDGKLFDNATYSCGIGSTSQLVLGWGCEFVDYDLDGYRDVIVGNGHVNDDVETYSEGIFYREPKQLFWNRRDGTFAEDPRSLGDMAEPSTTRGLAVGDFDNDGDPDALANNHNMDAQLFRNEGGDQNGWIAFRAVGSKCNRSGLGAKIWIQVSGRQQFAEVRSGSSFSSRNDPRVLFGLGKAKRIDSVRIRWPGGQEETARNLAARRFYVWTEGRGVGVDSRVRPLRTSSGTGRGGR